MTPTVLAAYQPEGERAPVDFAAAWAAATGAQLVIASADADGTGQGEALSALGRELRADTQRLTGASPARALHEAAEELRAGLVVVGATEHGATGRKLLGSTAQRLAHGAPCPLAVVPHGWTAGGGLKTVGAAYLDTPEGHEALHGAAAIARRTGASLRVLSAEKPHGFHETQGGGDALTPPTTYAEIGSALRANAERAVAAVAGEAGMPIEADVSVGDPGEFLVAASRHLDVLVMGSRGYGPRQAVLLGGVSARVTAEASCPVVVLVRGSEGALEAFAGAA